MSPLCVGYAILQMNALNDALNGLNFLLERSERSQSALVGNVTGLLERVENRVNEHTVAIQQVSERSQQEAIRGAGTLHSLTVSSSPIVNIVSNTYYGWSSGCNGEYNSD